MNPSLDSLRQFWHWTRLPRRAKAARRRDRNFRPGSDPGIDSSVAAAMDWLASAQDNSSSADGGVARHYSLIDGWGPSYPETTGYIAPTVLACSDSAGGGAMLDRARRMLDWLVAIQLPDGAFQGGTVADRPVVPVVFNTGQILIGLAAAAGRFGEPYAAAMRKAAGWLVEAQDADGRWRRYESPFALSGPRAYDTHVAWGLLEAARAAGEPSYADAALRNVRWALSRQRENGWFEDCCLTDPSRPLTHTLGYALRGIVEAYRFTEDPALLAAARRCADGLLGAVRDDGFLAGRLDERWAATVSWSCLTGSVQIAHCWLQLYAATGHEPYLDAGRAANAFVRRTVDCDGPDETRGGVRGSLPIFGGYGTDQYLNWAAKFFVDSNLLEKSICGEAR